MALEDLRSKINDLKFLMENENFSTGDPFNAKDIADNIKMLCEEILPSSSHFGKGQSFGLGLSFFENI